MADPPEYASQSQGSKKYPQCGDANSQQQQPAVIAYQNLPTMGARILRYGYKLNKRIAHGGFGTVFDVTEVSTGDRYALKQINRKQLVTANIDYQISCERYYLLKLDSHPLIVNMKHFIDDESLTVTVLQYAEKGDIDTYIDKYGLIDYMLARYFTIQIICAVNYLHENNIIHRDLKPQNILIMDTWNIALCDFMTAGPINAERYRREVENFVNPSTTNIQQQTQLTPPTLEEMRGNKYVGTAIYMSPEVAKSRKAPGILENKIRRSKLKKEGYTQDTIDDMEQTVASDNWSIGCILYFMMTGHPPFLTPPVMSANSAMRRMGGLSIGESYTPMYAISPAEDAVVTEGAHPSFSQAPTIDSTRTIRSRNTATESTNYEGLPATVRREEFAVPQPSSFPNSKHYEVFPQLGFYDTNANLLACERQPVSFSEFTKMQLCPFGHTLPPSMDKKVCTVLDRLMEPVPSQRISLNELLGVDMFRTGDPPVLDWSQEHVTLVHANCPIDHVRPYIPETKGNSDSLGRKQPAPPIMSPCYTQRPIQPAPRYHKGIIAADPWTDRNVNAVREDRAREEQPSSSSDGDHLRSSSNNPVAPKRFTKYVAKCVTPGNEKAALVYNEQKYIRIGQSKVDTPPGLGSPPKQALSLPERQTEASSSIQPPCSSMTPATDGMPSSANFNILVNAVAHDPESGLARKWYDPVVAKNIKEKQRVSREADGKWDKVLADDEIIIKMGVMRKRRGYYSIKTRMFLLTYSPSQQHSKTCGIRFSYYDSAKFEKYGWDKSLPPQRHCYKGEILLTAQVKEWHVLNHMNFVYLSIETPGRVYYLIDRSGGAAQWKHAIDTVMRNRYGADSYDV